MVNNMVYLCDIRRGFRFIITSGFIRQASQTEKRVKCRRIEIVQVELLSEKEA